MRLRGFGLALVLAAAAAAQQQTCSCGADPPGAPAARTLEPYGGVPDDLRPFAHFTKPYYENYTKEVEYNGAARDGRTLKPSDVSEVAIGFLGPIREHKDEALGNAMLHGAEMAVAEANSRGGYGGKPFALKVHNDAALWGASSNEIVKMVYEDKVWAMLGSISGDSTHIALRVSLRAELPIVNSAATDPTIPETIIPWILTTIQDDRVQSYTLARRIYSDLGLRRVALLRVNERYGRFGVIKFRDASRRLGHPLVIEQKFAPGDTDFTRQLRVIQDSDVDGIVLWTDAAPAAMILQQMRAMGMKQRVFGAARVVGADLFRMASDAAEGLEVVYPFDPNRDDAGWLAFQRRFTERHAAPVDSFAALGYDTMNLLLDAICRAGLNRGAIRDALYGLERYKGVTGEMIFDPNAKNIAPLYLGTVKNGRLAFRRYTMEKPYTDFTGQPVGYAGPPSEDLGAKESVIGVFGPQGDKVAEALHREGYRFVGIPSEQAWGKSSTALVNLVYEQKAIGIIATDRASAHLAEQIAVKTFVPVIALSADRKLTTTNIPWIFRLEPGTPPSKAAEFLIEAARHAGANRGRIREYLAAGSFDKTGERRSTP
ncbi:MAG TPA: ABC transporter substrate-binding protein [Bryobacteraceae bacterium]|nr:ABC transporter substrate-binding protein [Bryobacteraceae bacterium]